jgi:AcrR family transcriptional regulator
MTIETTATRAQDSKRARRERRREELLDVADRVIQRRGVGVSMDEIASEAGITKPVLYRHFGDKDGLYQALTERYVDELKTALKPATEASEPRDRLAAAIDAYLVYVEREPERYRFLLHASEQPRTAGIVADFRRRNIAECAFTAEDNLRRAGIDPGFTEPWAECVSGMIRAAGTSWLEARSLPRERLVDYLTTILWEGFSSLRRATAAQPSTGKPRGVTPRNGS